MLISIVLIIAAIIAITGALNCLTRVATAHGDVQTDR